MITLGPAGPQHAPLLAAHLAAVAAEGAGRGAAARRHRPATLRWLASGIASGRVLAKLAWTPEGEAVGSLGLMLLPGGRWVLHLYVAPGWRRRGIARRLVERAEDALLVVRLRQRLSHGAPQVPALGHVMDVAAPPETLLRLGGTTTAVAGRPAALPFSGRHGDP